MLNPNTHQCVCLFLITVFSSCTLPCEEGETDFEIRQNDVLIESGDQLVVGDIVVGGGFQGGGASPAMGAWLNFRLSGTSRHTFSGIEIEIFEGSELIGSGNVTSDFELEEDLCMMEDAYWNVFSHIAFPNAQSIFDIDGLDVKMEVQLITHTETTKEYDLKLYVE